MIRVAIRRSVVPGSSHNNCVYTSHPRHLPRKTLLSPSARRGPLRSPDEPEAGCRRKQTHFANHKDYQLYALSPYLKREGWGHRRAYYLYFNRACNAPTILPHVVKFRVGKRNPEVTGSEKQNSTVREVSPVTRSRNRLRLHLLSLFDPPPNIASKYNIHEIVSVVVSGSALPFYATWEFDASQARCYAGPGYTKRPLITFVMVRDDAVNGSGR